MSLTGESFAEKQNGSKVDGEELSSKHKEDQVRNFWTLSPLDSLVLLLPLLALVGSYYDSGFTC